jgi:hypothetical protein
MRLQFHQDDSLDPDRRQKAKNDPSPRNKQGQHGVLPTIVSPAYLPSLSKRTSFRIRELNPGLVGTDHLTVIESDKS